MSEIEILILYNTLNEMQKAITDGSFVSLQNKLYENCIAQGEATLAEQIHNVDWEDFGQTFSQTIEKILSMKNSEIKAIYYEYDTENNWCGALYACLSYNQLSEDDDDWACDWKEYFDLPDVPVYPQLKMDLSLQNKKSLSVFLYAISILTGVCAKIVHQLHSPIPICIGFHDQSTITRL